MSEMTYKSIQSALLSVYYKDGLDEIVNKLHAEGVDIISTGGTYDFIRSLGIPTRKVEDLTLYPNLFGGRVKTLHPLIMGGILHRRDIKSDVEQAAEHGISPIDLVIVDLYPFEETLAKTVEESEIIENIDIGGISLIRAAAKNFKDVVIVPSRQYYNRLLEVFEEIGIGTELKHRREFAVYAFHVSSNYDSCIFNYYNKFTIFPYIKQVYDKSSVLRYGENPHQNAYFFGNRKELFEQLHGKEISYNNFQDIEASVELVSEFDAPAFVIVKHANACGVAVRENIHEAWDAALSCDPLSAFGGVISCNRTIDKATAEKINEIFFEVITATDFTKEAFEILKSKKNRILLKMNDFPFPKHTYKSCFNGILMQDRDNIEMNPRNWKTVTKRQVPPEQIATLLFANKIVRHTKSNAIVLAGDSMLFGSGIGQTSRLDAVKLALAKAKTFKHNIKGSVLASDGFFPFTDGIEQAIREGVEYIIQPGGSIRDKEVIAFCDEHNVAMVFTGLRHFKH